MHDFSGGDDGDDVWVEVQCHWLTIKRVLIKTYFAWEGIQWYKCTDQWVINPYMCEVRHDASNLVKVSIKIYLCVRWDGTGRFTSGSFHVYLGEVKCNDVCLLYFEAYSSGPPMHTYICEVRCNGRITSWVPQCVRCSTMVADKPRIKGTTTHPNCQITSTAWGAFTLDLVQIYRHQD